MYLTVDAFTEAADVYLDAGLWDKARGVASQSGDARLGSRVEAAYAAHLQKTGQAEALASSGNEAAAIDLYARQGDWDKVPPPLIDAFSETPKPFYI
jgi:hypothetical protein